LALERPVHDEQHLRGRCGRQREQDHVRGDIHPGAAEFDVNGLARALGTTEYHLRRKFSSLAGMPLSEYVRRRRMTCAATEAPFAPSHSSGSA
jgi:AraC-like DNA-binding protein